MPRPDPLAHQPFSWTRRADGTIVVMYHGAPVTLIRGKTAIRFSDRVAAAEEAAAQQLMARATGQFKRGNERKGQARGR
ncbi:MAG: hypothetical protein ABIW50_07820 [Candidatus Limnocylindria bacterium]